MSIRKFDKLYLLASFAFKPEKKDNMKMTF